MMRAMFLEAEIAQNFELDCNKIEYVTKYGLKRYYQNICQVWKVLIFPQFVLMNH